MGDIADMVVTSPPFQGFGSVRRARWFSHPDLRLWSIRQADVTELTGAARSDFERELRITALGNLLCSSCATPLWRRVCCREMYREIRARSTDQRVAMELAIAESLRRPS